MNVADWILTLPSLLAETDRSLEAIGRHGDRIDDLLEQIKAVRAGPVDHDDKPQ